MGLFWLKLKVSGLAIVKVLRHSVYSLLAVLLAFVILGILLWIFQLNLIAFIFSQPLGLGHKIGFVLGGYAAVVTNFSSAAATTLLIFAILQGIAGAVMIYVWRYRLQARVAGKTTGALSAAILSSGCAACGSSLLTPVLTAVGASATTALTHTIGVVANLVAIAVALYALYSLGRVASGVIARVPSE